MKRIALSLTLICLAATLFGLAVSAQRPAPGALENFDIRAGRSSSTSGTAKRLWSLNQRLSPQSPLDAADAARGFLKTNAGLFSLEDGAVDRLTVSRRYQTKHNGVTHITFQQSLDGIDVFRAEVTVHLDRENAVISASGELLPDIARSTNTTRPGIDIAAALRRGATEAGATLTETIRQRVAATGPNSKQEIDAAGPFGDTVKARLVYFPFAPGELRLAWELILPMRETPDIYLILIDAERGSLLYRYNLTRYDENPLKPHGQVYSKESPRPNLPQTTNNPPVVQREDVPFHASAFNGSDIFQVADRHYDWWAGSSAASLNSNNTSAYVDRDASSNQPDLPLLVAADGNYSFPIDLTVSPTGADNQKASQTNLFYWVNRYHDILYSFGFDEAAGNFQSSNFGLGGLGNDAIRAEVQDGAGTNNANFSTPPDGQLGRVQMYLFTGTPDRDSALDQMVALHELTHGLSNRLIGNATGLDGTQADGMGEGWSDWFALTLLANEGDDPDATYPAGQFSTNNYLRGIRRFPYSTNLSVYPLTFKDIAINTEVHAIGEIWCNTLWEMRALLVKQYGFREGQRQSLQLVVDGLTLTPNAPSFIDAREAILAADRINNGGANQCLLWQAFAKRGLGYTAFAGDTNDTAPRENRDTPPYCSATASIHLDKTDYIAGELIEVSLSDQNATPGAVTVRLSSSATGDHESLALSPDQSLKGVFNGAIKLVQGNAISGDGILEGSVEKGDQILVAYDDPSGSSGGPVQATAAAGITREKVVFEDTVESGNQGWIKTGTWGITTARSSSPTHCWTDSPAGSYSNLSSNSLTSPRFDFTGLSDVTLTFAYSGALEDRFDVGAIEYSNDDGVTFVRAFTIFSATTPFVQARISLPGLAGQSRARIRFRLLADGGVTADGLYIDDIRLIARSASAVVIAPGSEPVPVIAAVSPAFGPPAGGTKVLVTGMNFTEDETTTVTFDGTSGSAVKVLGGTALEVVTPAHPTGAVTVRVSNLHGAAAAVGAFTYYVSGTGAGAPLITSVFPASGTTRGGTTVTVVGSNFNPDTRIRFGNFNATTTFINSSTVRAVTPQASAGVVNVTALNGTLQSTINSAFNYVSTTPPIVEVISPDGGESFFGRATMTIRWRSSDDQAVVRHRIILVFDNGTTLTDMLEIASDVPGTEQSYSWTIPTISQTANFRIRVIAIDNEGVEAADISTASFTLNRRWNRAPELPVALSFANAASDGKFIYLFGGRTTSQASSAIATLWRLDTSAASPAWSSTDLPPMPTALFWGEACFLKGKIYIPGGVTAQNTVTGLHYAYDIASNTWATRASQATVAYAYSVAVDEARGIFYLSGGTRMGAPSTIVRSYDPGTDTWADLPSMNTARRGHESVMIEGRLYVIGGEGSGGTLNSGEVYDFTTKAWSPIASLSRQRVNAASVVTKNLAGNPLWLVIAGQSSSTEVLSPSEVYDVRTNRWTPLDGSFTPATPRFGMAGAVAGDNFYAMGGSTLTLVTTVVNEQLRIDTLEPAPAAVSPVVVVPDTQVAVANARLKFTVSANDLGATMPVTMLATGLPAGADFTTNTMTNGSIEGTFAWTPVTANVGQTFNVTFTVSSQGLSDSKVVVIRVVDASKLTVVDAASYRGERLARDSIVAAFGTNLAVRTLLNDVLPLPVELAGTKVTVNGVPAPLFFVSAAQLNFAIPVSVELGPATIIVSNPNGSFAHGEVEIVPTAPSIFSADSSGSGDAAAQATPDGITYQNPPFDVTVGGKPNVLVLYGTGIRHAIAADPGDGNGVAEACTVAIGGLPASVLYAGAQGVFFGLDQMNVVLPAGLAGTGPRRVEIVLSVNGVEANRLTIAIK